MDKIKEVMGLVDEFALICAEDDDGDDFNRRVINARRAVKSKLRELLEREPLSEDRIETLFMSTELECMSSDDIEDAIAFARLIEADHGIGNESKEM